MQSATRNVRLQLLRAALCTQAAFFSTLLVVGLALQAGGSAASPQAVFQPLDVSGPIPMAIADGRGTTGFRASDAELARWALGAWQRASENVIRFQPAPESSALVRLYLGPAD